MAFELHPILENDACLRPGLWYAVAATEGDGPTARVGSAAVQARDAGSAIFCAGASPEETFSDLHRIKIDSESISWEKLPSTSLPPRYEHTLVVGPGGNDVFVFAGAQENGPLCDMWICSTDGGDWRKISSTGQVPSPRTHHSSTCVWRDKMVVFSGGDCGTKTQDTSVYFFDMISHTWVKPAVEGTPPSPRQGHILAVVGDTLYIHGGMTADGEIISSLHTLNLVHTHTEQLKWSQPQVEGSTPSPALAAHGCGVIGTQIYTFGGLSSNGACSTLYCFNTDSRIWNEVKIEGASPPARLDHAMTTITLNLPHTSSLTPSQKSQTSQKSHHTAKQPRLVTVLSPEVDNEDSNDKPQIVKESNASKFDGCLAENGKDVLENGKQDASMTGEFTAERQRSEGERSEGERNDGERSEGERSDGEGRAEVGSSTKCFLDKAEEKGEREISESDATLFRPNDTLLEREVENRDGQETAETVVALLVFGGMDTSGHVHNDCFVFVPPK